MTVGRLMIRGAAVVLATVLAGCTAEGTSDGPTQTVLTLDDARAWVEDEDYRVVGSVLTELDGRRATFEGFAADGTEIYVRHAQAADGDLQDDDPYAVALVARDPQTQRTRVLSDRARRQGPVDRDRIPGNALAISAVTVSGERVAWVESPSRGHGHLYVHDLSDDSQRRLVRSQAHADSRPVIQDGFVHFVNIEVEVEGDDLERMPPPVASYRVPWDGTGEPELVSRGARAVFGASDGHLWMASDVGLVRWDPERGAEGEVPGTRVSATCGAAARGGLTVACDGPPAVLHVRSAEHGEVTVEVGPHAGYVESSGQAVAFTAGLDTSDPRYVLSVARGDLVRVPPKRFLRPVGGETWLVTSARPADGAQVITFLP